MAALGFVQTYGSDPATTVIDEGGTTWNATPQPAGDWWSSANDFIVAHKTAVIGACVGLFALAILGELGGRR
jgi:hypothetical protein